MTIESSVGVDLVSRTGYRGRGLGARMTTTFLRMKSLFNRPRCSMSEPEAPETETEYGLKEMMPITLPPQSRWATVRN